MSKLSKIAASAAVVPMLAFSAPAFAASLGTLGGGDNYLAKNVTQNGSYSNNTSATCNDVVQYSMELSNTQFGTLNDVTVTATLPSAGGVSTATATTNLGGSTGATDTTTVTLSGNGATQSYVSGSTVLYDDSGNVIKTLPDTITTSGVSIGALVGSTNDFLDFKAKVSCTPTQTCTPPQTGTFPNCTTPQTPQKPTTLVNTGAGSVAGIFAGAIVLGTAAYSFVTRRRLSRQ